MSAMGLGCAKTRLFGKTAQCLLSQTADIRRSGDALVWRPATHLVRLGRRQIGNSRWPNFQLTSIRCGVVSSADRVQVSHASRASAGRSRQRQSKWARSTGALRTALATAPFLSCLTHPVSMLGHETNPPDSYSHHANSDAKFGCRRDRTGDDPSDPSADDTERNEIGEYRVPHLLLRAHGDKNTRWKSEHRICG